MPGFDPVVLRRTLANPTRRDGYWWCRSMGGATGATIGTGNPPAARPGKNGRKRPNDSPRRSTANKNQRGGSGAPGEAKRHQQRAEEQRRREEKARRKAEHERREQEIAACKAALLAQGIVPESRAERKRRLAREAAERAARRPQRL